MTDRARGLNVFVTVLLVIVFSWLWLQWTHEAGHLLAGKATGAGVQRVVLDPLAFSRTDLVPNPHPLIACWGGPIIGVLLGAGLPMLLATRASQSRWIYHAVAAFVLVGNGAYIGLGALSPAGDAEVMLDLGTPQWTMIAFGLGCLVLAWPLYRIARSSAWLLCIRQAAVVAVLLVTLAASGRLAFPG